MRCDEKVEENKTNKKKKKKKNNKKPFFIYHSAAFKDPYSSKFILRQHQMCSVSFARFQMKPNVFCLFPNVPNETKCVLSPS